MTIQLAMRFCRVCGRALSSAESVERGIGPVCAEKHGAGRQAEMFRASYTIVEDVAGQPLVIRDRGEGRSVTNDAERVVEELWQQGMLPGGRRLLYWDTMNQCDELVHNAGVFVRFAPGPREVQA